MALEVVTPRIDRLRADLNTAEFLTKNNSHWSKKELDIALFGFCYAKASEDILYQLCCMSGRHDDIVNELKGLIKQLESKNEK